MKYAMDGTPMLPVVFPLFLFRVLHMEWHVCACVCVWVGVCVHVCAFQVCGAVVGHACQRRPLIIITRRVTIISQYAITSTIATIVINAKMDRRLN